jgi:hypothetical protein
MKLLLIFTLSLMCGSVCAQNGTELSIEFDEDVTGIICDSASRAYSQIIIEITNEEPKYKKPYAKEKHTYKFLNDSVFIQILPKSKQYGRIQNGKIAAYDIKEKKTYEILLVRKYDSLDYTIEMLKFPSNKNPETVYRRFKTDSLGREIESFVQRDNSFTSTQIDREFLNENSVKEIHYDVKDEKTIKRSEIIITKVVNPSNGMIEKEVTKHLHFNEEEAGVQGTAKMIIQKVYSYNDANLLTQIEILEYDREDKVSWDRKSTMRIQYK